MRFNNSKEHAIDVVFALALFFVFAASAMAIIIVSLQSYGAISDKSKSNYNGRTSIAYIAQKVRSGDTNNNIYIKEHEDITALAINTKFGDSKYVTYIYEHNGELKELFCDSELEFNPDAGTKIVDVDSFVVQQKQPGLLMFKLTDDAGKEHSLVIGLRS